MLLGVFQRIYLRMRLGDSPLLVDEVGDTLGETILVRIGRAVGESYFLLVIRDQRIGEAELRREGEALFRLVETDADDLGVQLSVFVVTVPEPGPLIPSAGCVRLREEPQHDPSSAVIAQTNAIAARVGRIEIGRCRTDRKERPAEPEG